MQAKRKKKKNKLKKYMKIISVLSVIAAIIIYVYITYKNIDINNSNYETERVISTVNEQTVEKAEENRTAIVVVFIPPAVDPGEPPINIRIIIRYNPVSLIAVRFIVLKPAVLGVTD